FSSTASFLSMFCMLWVMWQLNEMLTFISCITLPMLILGIRVYGQVMKQRSMEAHKADSQVASFIQQTVNTIPTIQSFVRQNRVAQKFNVFIQDAWGKRLSQHATEIIYQTTVATIFSLGMAGIIWAGAREVLADRLTVGELVVFITYLSQFYEPLQKLILAGSTLADAQAGVSRVFEILDTPPAITSPANGITLDAQGKESLSIEFENVSFGYHPRRPIIRNATFSVKPGEFVAIVGPSGAGKTTLAKLISRFFDPEQGSVKINGVDLRRYDLDSLRRNVSVVHQEPLILPGTLRDNILFGREGATEAEMVEVAEQVHAAEFIEQLPQRYDTTVGDGGSRLSIGEVQRLCLARALLKNAPILILDEPTSSLDAENQMYVVDALGRLAKGRTTLMIAHRLSTLVNATRIIVLVDGQIQATGTHDELLETSEYYRRAVEAGSRSIQAD
ncbi:MAG: ABC transporter ATP-binding protein, partial [Verrucomicrobia bacterium]|nr:ABC transporter ATP-binding protein [Verrucomicrobiota bacterium]